MAKQKKLIIILAAVFCVLLGAYFFAVSPLVNKEDPPEETKPIETSSGEVIGTDDRILLFEQVERENLRSIEVHNEYGEYTFYRDSEDIFRIKGHEEITFDPDLFSSFITSCGYTLSLSRVDGPEDMDEYGLVERKDESGKVIYTPVWYKLTTTAGVEHVVYIGDQTVSGDGYYARYEGRDSVYVLKKTIADTVLEPVENMVTPLISYYEYSLEKKISKFRLFKDGELMLQIEPLDESEAVDADAFANYKMTYPTSYVPSDDCDTIFRSLASLQGTKTVALGITDEDMKKYGIENPAYQITFEFEGVENYLAISARQEDGTYYVGSGLFDIIAVCDAETVAFAEHELIKWVSPSVFKMSIDAVDTLEFRGNGFSETYKVEGSKETLTVRKKSDGKDVDVLNFKNLYKELLTANIEGTAALTEQEKETLKKDENNCFMTMTVTTRSGIVREYKFYRYSERRTYYTINGSGEFYILHNVVDKIFKDAARVAKGETVDVTEKY